MAPPIANQVMFLEEANIPSFCNVIANILKGIPAFNLHTSANITECKDGQDRRKVRSVVGNVEIHGQSTNVMTSLFDHFFSEVMDIGSS